MNKALNTRVATRATSTLARAAAAIARRAAPLLGAVLVTFLCVHSVANYALPQPAPVGTVLASAATAKTTAAPVGRGSGLTVPA